MVLTVVVSRPFAKKAKGWGTQGLFSLTQREGHPPIFYSRTQRDHIVFDGWLTPKAEHSVREKEAKRNSLQESETVHQGNVRSSGHRRLMKVLWEGG
jgi:hypothetical protein